MSEKPDGYFSVCWTLEDPVPVKPTNQLNSTWIRRSCHEWQARYLALQPGGEKSWSCQRKRTLCHYITLTHPGRAGPMTHCNPRQRARTWGAQFTPSPITWSVCVCVYLQLCVYLVPCQRLFLSCCTGISLDCLSPVIFVNVNVLN